MQNYYGDNVLWFKNACKERFNITPEEQIVHRFANRVHELVWDVEYLVENARETALKEYMQ